MIAQAHSCVICVSDVDLWQEKTQPEDSGADASRTALTAAIITLHHLTHILLCCVISGAQILPEESISDAIFFGT